jgi:Flp pilus assembly protein TadG
MTKTPLHNERGAVLIHTAIALTGLLAFSALSIDYGVMWVARGQAQNAADAAALAAATSMAYGDPTDLDRIRSVAVAAAQANMVWGAAPAVNPATDVTIGPCPPGTPGIADQCVRVDVYRNQQRANPLPTFFAQLVGVTEQGVRATATAQVAAGDSSECIRPWGIPDKWVEVVPTPKPWELSDQFNRYLKQGNTYTLLSPGDYYVPSTVNSPGSGFSVPADVGLRVTLKIGSPSDTSLASGSFLPIALPGTCASGGNCYREHIASCNGTTLAIGDVIESEPGNMIGPTKQGVEDLIAQDPAAVWMCNDGSVAAPGSNCAGYVSTGASPRLVPLPVFNVQQWQDDVASGNSKGVGRYELQITRLIGFFVEPMNGNDVVGRVTYYPTSTRIGNGGIHDSTNFLRMIILVR